MGNQLIKLLNLNLIQNPLRIAQFHSKLSSNAHRGAIAFQQMRDYFAMEKQIRKNPKLANCQKYFDSEPGCQVAYTTSEIIKERLNASMEGIHIHKLTN